MDLHHNSNMRDWKVLCSNIRGINSRQKWTALRSKIQETGCDIIYLQETKRENFDATYLKNFTPSFFDSFDFVLSQGASGGTIIIWKRLKFVGHTMFPNNYAMSVELTSTLNGIP
jgi:exonuclease III